MPNDLIRADADLVVTILERLCLPAARDDLPEVVARVNAILDDAATWDDHDPFAMEPWSPTMVRRQ